MCADHIYITSIDVKGLWGETDLHWSLTPSVNILSGSNGSGKSTILRSLADLFRNGEISPERVKLTEKVTITFSDGQVVDSDTKLKPGEYNALVISTFDSTIKDSTTLSRLSDGQVNTELDWELFRTQNSYLSYQLAIGREIISALTEGKSQQEVTMLTDDKKRFFDILDSLFKSTGKRVKRSEDSLLFTVGRRTITPYQLSSGEKQILFILTSVLVQNRRPSILIMDEPEISLHFDWQRRLIEDILILNPNLQLIVATHSPAVVMNGWVDCVSEISELVIDEK